MITPTIGSPHTIGDSPYVEWMPYQIGQAREKLSRE